MNVFRAVLAVAGISFTLAACSGMGGFNFGSGTPAANTSGAPTAPPVSLAGRWLLSQPGRGQCHMNFGAASPQAPEGTIAPEGGCPGKFYMSRKWTYDSGGLTMRDHNSQPLAQLSAGGGGFQGKATSGEAITLMR